jgi:hypothetical protein
MTGIDEHAQEFLAEQWIACRSFGDQRGDWRWNLSGREESREQSPGIRFIERLEVDK